MEYNKMENIRLTEVGGFIPGYAAALKKGTARAEFEALPRAFDKPSVLYEI